MSETRCPECEQGKHANCTGTAWDVEKDQPTKCPCTDFSHREVER